MSSILVRSATLGDLDGLVPLFDAYRQFYRKPSDQALARRFLSQRLEGNQSAVLAAFTEADEVVGFVQRFPSFSSVSAAPIWILNDLFVHPEARRQKVASLLLAAAARFGKESGAVRLTLSTEITNIAAQASYNGAGWKRQTEFYAYDLAVDP